MITKSLAKTSRQYVVIQLAPYGNGNVHIQAKGHEGNRNYGLALNVKSPELEAALNKVVQKSKSIQTVTKTKTLQGVVDVQVAGAQLQFAASYFAKSLAGTNRDYVLAQAAPYAGDDVHIQILSDEPLNRDYGFAITLKGAEEFSDYLREELDN